MFFLDKIFTILFKRSKLKIQLSILILTALIISGCSSSNKQIKTPIVKKTIVYKKDMKIDDTPKWILNPNKHNYICSIGSASITDKKTTNTIAKMKAKANISKQISIYIDSQSKSIKNRNGKSKFTTSSSQQSTNMLRGIKFVDNYTDKPNNRYYIRACSKI